MPLLPFPLTPLRETAKMPCAALPLVVSEPALVTLTAPLLPLLPPAAGTPTKPAEPTLLAEPPLPPMLKAAIALAEYSRDWRVMAYAVNVGGFGWMVGSLANLIALRMANDSRAWLSFHLYSLPFLLAAAVVGFVLLFTLGVAGP